MSVLDPFSHALAAVIAATHAGLAAVGAIQRNGEITRRNRFGWPLQHAGSAAPSRRAPTTR